MVPEWVFGTAPDTRYPRVLRVDRTAPDSMSDTVVPLVFVVVVVDPGPCRTDPDSSERTMIVVAVHLVRRRLAVAGASIWTRRMAAKNPQRNRTPARIVEARSIRSSQWDDSSRPRHPGQCLVQRRICVADRRCF